MPDASEVVPYLTSAATIAYVHKWLKTTDYYTRFVSAFPGADRYAHWFTAGIMSLVAAVGIHWTYTGTLSTGGTITFAIPPLVTLLHGMADWFKVYILQHFAHDTVKRADSVTQNTVNAQGSVLVVPSQGISSVTKSVEEVKP